MCGIAGMVAPAPGLPAARLERIAAAMSDRLRHRGPDDSGTWADAEAGIAFGHRRLSIIDLSPAGHQPMASRDGRFVVTYNGEIYNFQALRAELETEGARFRGHSDTEVLVEACAHWGLARALERLNGMFAFAIWDRRERVLHLARDRVGEKPLYYGWAGKSLVFASELKGLEAHPDFRREIDRGALSLLVRHDYVPAPYAIYRGVYKLPPAALLSLPLAAIAEGPAGGRFETRIRPYWSIVAAARSGLGEPLREPEEAVVEELDRRLRASVAARMVADVPLGAFLSGGIDSSTVVAVMQAQSRRPVKTFTIGFHEHDYNEAVHAKAVAEHLGTEHTELYLTAKQAMAVIPRLPALYDEPFADASQIPTFLVADLARRHVTVSLSGDAGDELFGGYHRYFVTQIVLDKIGWLPVALRGAVAGLLRAPPLRFWNLVFACLGPALPDRLRPQNPADKMFKVAEVLAAATPREIYRMLISYWRDPAAIVVGGADPATALGDDSIWAAAPDLAHRMMLLDTLTYLPDDILVKVDRACMGVSLESRVPYLDHELVEFAWRIPLGLKVRDGQGKWALRRVLDRYVPRELIERPKMGFGVPIDSWLRGPLRDWAEALLDEGRLRAEGLFEPAPIRQRWAEHLSGRRNWQYHLWSVLMFQSWREAQERERKVA